MPAGTNFPTPGPVNELQVEFFNCSDPAVINPPDLENYIECEQAPTPENQVCVSRFTSKMINPYTVGVLGNWRADKTYAYYGERRERTVIDKSPLRRAGVIKDYQTFWDFGSSTGQISISPLATTSTKNTPPWNLTGESTQFNSKGFELENRDPLQRYNCGIYGYNDGLPVAVVNNSKLRQSAFDGFEDYGFETSGCQEICKPGRHSNIENVKTYISDLESHTGLYSLLLNPGQSVTLSAPIVNDAIDGPDYGINITRKTTVMSGTWIDYRGTGLDGKYKSLANYFPLEER